ncbi:HlyD family secretion protein [Candidimonas nitroreducens]|uniref:Secretion protein n=1 Tax=Candidimonas nitroreducens TaxID=683354 RepID=A0A225M8H3_9BURK|nr:HlyD family efflux transporter periplasmic adaptor subunit [Candidimonas nitroreducens]OWT57635.1 secretion protein [Candidimonas nitroreducens]
MSLFRKEALQARQTPWLGEIVLVRPISFGIAACAAAACALAVCLFLALGTYTKRVTVNGRLAPDTGLIKLYAPHTGIVVERRVHKGQTVRAGDLLYTISTDTQNPLGSTQEAISAQVGRREASLRAEQQRSQLIEQSERAGIAQKIASLQAQIAALDTQVSGQRDRLALSRRAVARYRKLVAQGYVSQEQLEGRQEEALDQSNQLQSLRRNRIELNQQLATQRSDLAQLDLKQRNKSAQFERDLSNAAEALTQSEAKRRLMVTAPVAGTVTTALAQPGQTISSERPLATLTPAGARLVAELYAPSRAIGFVRPGTAVLIRYQAYPYQTYGQQPGTVLSVAQAGLAPSQFGDDAVRKDADGEPLYLIRVRLDSQDTAARGQHLALLPGMTLEADIMLQKRRLYQWALEPLYGLWGRF